MINNFRSGEGEERWSGAPVRAAEHAVGLRYFPELLQASCSAPPHRSRGGGVVSGARRMPPQQGHGHGLARGSRTRTPGSLSRRFLRRPRCWVRPSPWRRRRCGRGTSRALARDRRCRRRVGGRRRPPPRRRKRRTERRPHCGRDE